MPKTIRKERFSKARVISRLLPKLSKRDWAHQMIVFKSLFELYPQENFWNKVIFNIELTSLEYLKFGVGANLLRKKYIEFNYIVDNNHKEIILSDNKYGENLNLKIKPKNIRDFINGKEK